MSASTDQPVRRRFDSFELDLATGELLKNGRRIKLQDQPTRLLMLLTSRPGELVTRPEIQKMLWEDGRFVEVEHGINTAIKKVREVLGDDPEHPRIIETLPKKGYRFIVPVEEIRASVQTETIPAADVSAVEEAPAPDERKLDEGFALPHSKARFLFLLVQAVYVWIYGFTLVQMNGLDRVLVSARYPFNWLTVPILTAAACGIGIRIYLLSSVGVAHPAAGFNYQRMLPYLMVWDWLWALSPFLVADEIGAGWSIIFLVGLAWLPFSQRTLMRSLYPPTLK